MRLSVIVAAFGKEALLRECLSSLVVALERVEGETELIVVVNDGAIVPAASAPRFTTLEGDRRLGFAGAVALGLARARGEWVALVNDDCAVDPDALAELLAAGGTAPDVGSVAAQVRFAGRTDTINSAGIEVDELGVARERRLGELAATAETEMVDVFGASATLALYRREMLDSLGGLDRSFFAYLEDADLAWRARMAGWRCVLAARAVAFHRHSATLGHSSSAKHILVGRNRVRMLAKNATPRQLRRRLVGIVVYDLLYIAHEAVRGRTLAPLAGRLRGLGEWRAYRAAGGPARRETQLPPPPGLRDALRRNRVYRSVHARPVGGGGELQ